LSAGPRLQLCDPARRTSPPGSAMMIVTKTVAGRAVSRTRPRGPAASRPKWRCNLTRCAQRPRAPFSRMRKSPAKPGRPMKPPHPPPPASAAAAPQSRWPHSRPPNRSRRRGRKAPPVFVFFPTILYCGRARPRGDLTYNAISAVASRIASSRTAPRDRGVLRCVHEQRARSNDRRLHSRRAGLHSPRTGHVLFDIAERGRGLSAQDLARWS
jgi:hypothetical protein